MSTNPIEISGDLIDLGGRIAATTTVVASPPLAAEVVIATLNLPSHMRAQEFALLQAWVAFLVGATGTAVRFRIRKNTLTGAVVADTDALTAGIAAGGKGAQDVTGVDGSGTDVYVLTMQVTGGSAVSTVSALVFGCEIF